MYSACLSFSLVNFTPRWSKWAAATSSSSCSVCVCVCVCTCVWKIRGNKNKEGVGWVLIHPLRGVSSQNIQLCKWPLLLPYDPLLFPIQSIFFRMILSITCPSRLGHLSYNSLRKFMNIHSLMFETLMSVCQPVKYYSRFQYLCNNVLHSKTTIM